MKLSLIVEKAITYTNFAEQGTSMSPYFVTSISNDKTYRSTTQVNHGLNPVFNEGCTFNYEGEELLKLEFYHDTVTLGGINIKVNTLLPTQVLKADYDIFIGKSLNGRVSLILRMESQYYHNNVRFNTGTGIGLGLNNLNFEINTLIPNRNYYQEPQPYYTQTSTTGVYTSSYSSTSTDKGIITNTNYNHVNINNNPYNVVPTTSHVNPQEHHLSTVSIKNPGQNINISTSSGHNK